MNAVGLAAVGAALILGLGIGFVIGNDSGIKCRECLSESGSRYLAGYKDGFREGVKATAEQIEQQADEAERGCKAAWVIRKDELERIREDLIETAYV